MACYNLLSNRPPRIAGVLTALIPLFLTGVIFAAIETMPTPGTLSSPPVSSPTLSPAPTRTPVPSPSSTLTPVWVITPTPPRWTTPVPGSSQETTVDEVHRSISHLVAEEVYKFDNYFGSPKLEQDARALPLS
ncbi:MAG: hypothetical protein V1789_03145 [PVC group bacterium]